ncbi:hypothetical protein SCORR_v1c08400 [Spiroplasma corruscae]|uniref:Uncharacterized protein n=1 Tax=Spiroplasma corruscae TaxID=216934 RepID=A0A222EQ79_9MOLU|nr:hypothetical protein [Spiroplasma corruscae]ASP28612.1 hypothetical protein SCORR_v1c08400 [Spiroplasma corruscae]
MAKIDEKGIIEFNLEDFDAAWNNAPKLDNKPENEYRLCFICKFHMLKDNLMKGDLPWNIEIIDLKNFSLDKNNFVAIHNNCKEIRPKQNCSKLLLKIKSLRWMYDESFYNK